jgi:uncharacterized protein YbaR (Trm112 family)
MLNPELLNMLVCPQCKQELQHDPRREELICHKDRLAYPIRDDIPVMLTDEARRLDDED